MRNAKSRTYNTRCIADTEIVDNLLGKYYRDTDVIAHPINIGSPEFRIQWTSRPSGATLAAPRTQRSAVYGAINGVVTQWKTFCNNNRYHHSSPTFDQSELYDQLQCRPPSQWGIMEHWSLRPRQLQNCPVTTWNEMFTSTTITSEFGPSLHKPQVINRMLDWCTTAFPPLAPQLQSTQPTLLLRGMRDATYRRVNFRLQALRELHYRYNTLKKNHKTTLQLNYTYCYFI